MRFEDLAGREVVVWGAGREGRAAYSVLQQRGITATFAVTGAGAVPADLAAVTATDADAEQRLIDADVVIKSPGVPHASDEFRRLKAAGVTITSLTELWLSANAHRVLAVTGTKGKSTTSALAAHLLNSLGVTATLVGNGGTPVTDGDSDQAQVAVTEVSSYQAADLAVSPRVAIVTSLFPEHLPWHGSYEQYVADKLNMVAHGSELIIVPDLDGSIAELVRERCGGARLVDPATLGITVTDSGIRWAQVGSVGSDEVSIRGRHNLVNVALALTAVAAGFDVPGDELLAAVRTFAPLAHRLETVPSNDGRRWVDDSLATAPEAVVAALESFTDGRVAVVVGGSDRGLSFEPLRAYLSGRSSGPVEVVAVGPAGQRWIREGGCDSAPSILAPSFAEAMRYLRDTSTAEVVLLSPGAPSFDEFASFEERSAAFRTAATSA